MKNGTKFINKVINKNENLVIMRLFVLFLIVFALMAAINPTKFLRPGNFSSMAIQFPELGILAIGMMLAMIAGGIDLSMVGVANLSGIVAGLILTSSLSKQNPASSMVLACVLAICCGAICGTLNGFLIAKIGIPPILATLGSMQLFSGIGIAITKGPAIYGFPEAFQNIGNGKFGAIPYPLIIFAIAVICIAFILNNTIFGNHLYMMGSNKTAARFATIDNENITIKTHLITGVLSAIAGLIIISRGNSAKADYGTSYTLQALLTAVLGGISPTGGEGNVFGVVLAVMILQVLSSGFNMIPQINNFFKEFVWGLVLVVVMVIKYFSNKK